MRRAAQGLASRLMIDASHANSSKKPENQIPVCADIAAQVAGGEGRIVGVMVESHLVAGRQDLIPGKELVYGQSVTDGCIDWDSSVKVWRTWPMPYCSGACVRNLRQHYQTRRRRVFLIRARSPARFLIACDVRPVTPQLR
jgi:hypothetical protein